MHPKFLLMDQRLVLFSKLSSQWIQTDRKFVWPDRGFLKFLQHPNKSIELYFANSVPEFNKDGQFQTASIKSRKQDKIIWTEQVKLTFYFK